MATGASATDSVFKVGAKVVYPAHGVAEIIRREKREFDGEKRDYLILRSVIGEMKLSVPVDKAEEVGVRPPVGAEELDDLVAVLAKPDPRVPSNWSRRFKNHQEKLKSGDVYQVAEVVRNLALRDADKGLSAGEKSMFVKARQVLVSELAFALNISEDTALDRLNKTLS
ncbi:MAG: CarD family transcriptional regulator [Acidimicrobiales bacterium]